MNNLIKYLNILVLVGILCFSGIAHAETIHGKVISIADGDTFTLLDEDYTRHKIRLAEIDTPEKGQPYGSQSQKVLSKLIFGKAVAVEKMDIDRYGRVIGRVWVQENNETIDVNRALVRSGAAWVYRKYMEDASLLEVEEEAKAQRKGIWSLSEADRVPPWEWRKRSQEQINRDIRQNRKPSGDGKFTCGTKRYCGDMSSCAEARFHLKDCGLTRLDGDNDGTPCESLCR